MKNNYKLRDKLCTISFYAGLVFLVAVVVFGIWLFIIDPYWLTLLPMISAIMVCISILGFFIFCPPPKK